MYKQASKARDPFTEVRRQDQDQVICEQFVREFPDLGYALCYLFGVYRGRGLARSEAEQRVRAELPCMPEDVL